MADRNLRIRMLLEAGDRVSRPLRDMAGGSSKLAQSLKTTRDRLKEIDRAQADIAGFRQLKAGIQSTAATMQAAKTRAAALGRQIAQTSAPTKAMARDFAKAKAEAERLTRPDPRREFAIAVVEHDPVDRIGLVIPRRHHRQDATTSRADHCLLAGCCAVQPGESLGHALA